ncbi:hypothetical protein FOMPIDRAFT_1013919 [Fomitopsis schrenkii]|uniref:Uncharacterized protein n=1 Tax=Fomitopsis schrenkii TaxID=2126942 RepID=S8FTL7_FOMSC|nr:hypothetical protein FOMPIDRAFT_1013919 [Fomitopsis schrenkii]
MLVKSVIVFLSLLAILPVSAAPAPLVTSTVIELPGIVTLTVGAILPTEIPNPVPTPTNTSSARRHANMNSKAPGLFDATEHVPGAENVDALFDAPSLLRRQIRINNYDATNNSMTEPLLGGAPHLLARGNKKAEAIEAARQKAAEAAAPPPSPPAAGGLLGAVTPMKAITGGIQGLGTTRMQSSKVFHDALGEVFNPGAALQSPDSSATSSASAPKPTYTKAATPLPVGPGYTTDTMDTTPEKAPTKTKVRRHSFMLDLNALLPEPSPESATPSPVQAWQNGALFELDSNRRPNRKVLSQNVTNAATNATSTAQGVAGNVTKST